MAAPSPLAICNPLFHKPVSLTPIQDQPSQEENRPQPEMQSPAQKKREDEAEELCDQKMDAADSGQIQDEENISLAVGQCCTMRPSDHLHCDVTLTQTSI